MTTRPATRGVALTACFIAVLACVSWRRGVYFSGSFDPVTLAKAVLSFVALALAGRAAVRTPQRNVLGTRTLWFLAGYIVITMLGAVADHTVFASLVLSVRVAVIAATMYLLLLAFPARVVLDSVVISAGTIGVVAGLTGLPAAGGTGRLEGGFLPLHPNEIAQLCGITIVVLVWRVVNGKGRGWYLPLLMVLSGLVWLTGSRTGLVALAAGLALLFLQVRRLPVPVVAVLLLLIPPVAYLALGTDVLGHLFDRGGSQNVTTLSNRTVAWSAALHFHMTTWDQWFGSGMSVVKIPVVQKYRNDQILDSSWVSALVQGGWLGIGLLGVWALSSVIAALRSRPPMRLLATSLLVFLIGRSFLETGLVDATVGFLIFFTLGVSVERVSGVGERAAAPVPELPEAVAAAV